MGAAESKLRFKNHVFKLGNTSCINAQDPYWQMYWKEPESANDIFELLTTVDIRTIRNNNITNFLLLVRIITLRLIYLANHKEFPSTNASGRELLNCVRLLTRLLPFLYESPNLSSREKSMFWSTRVDAQSNSPNSFSATVGSDSTTSSYSNLDAETASTEANVERITNKSKVDLISNSATINKMVDIPLGAKLVKCCVDLLFKKKFTLESDESMDRTSGSEIILWEPGIASTVPFKNPKTEIDSNRLELLRLLLVLFSECIYTSPATLANTGSRFLTCFVAATPKIDLITLLCSLINTTCRISRSSLDNGLIFHNSSLSELRHLTVTYSIQLLTLMIVYPLPKDTAFLQMNGLINEPPRNMARLHFGKIYKDDELLLIESSLLNILKKPITSTSESESSAFGLIKGTNRNNDPSIWATEVVMLLWELFQCNKRFKVHASDKVGPELIVILLYYIFNYRHVEIYKSFVRICSYFLLYLSSDPVICSKILSPFDNTFYNFLPQHFKTSPSPNTYRDFIVIQTCFMLNNDYDGHMLTPTFVEWLYNFIPLASKDLSPSNSNPSVKTNKNPGGGLSYHACSSITQVVVKFSTQGFLLANTVNSDLLALLIRSICHTIIRNPCPSRTLIYTIITNQRVYDKVLSTIDNFNPNSKPAAINVFDNSETNLEDDLQHLSLSKESLISKNSSNPTDNAAQESHKRQKSEDYEIDDSLLRPKQPPGMSQRAKSKLPINAPLKRGWGGMDALKTILMIIPILKAEIRDLESNRSNINQILSNIEDLKFSELYASMQINDVFSPKVKLEQLKFIWSIMSLGWYESILWGCIYNSNDVSKNSKIMNNLTNSISSFSKFSSDWGFKNWSNSETKQIEIANKTLTNVNVWNNTNIKLFRIRAQDNLFPGIIQASGAVDMASSLVKKFSDFRKNRTSIVSVNSELSASNTPIDESFNNQFKLILNGSLTPRNSLSRSSTGSNRNSVSAGT